MQNVRTKAKKKSFIGRLVSSSLLVSLLSEWSEKLRSFISGSFLARIFDRSEKNDKNAAESFAVSTVRGAARSDAASYARHAFASGVETSAVVGIYRRFFAALSSASVRSAGVFLLSSAFYSALVCAVRVLRKTALVLLYKDIIFIVLALIASAFMIVSRKSLGAKFCQSAFLSFIFFDALGLNRMAIDSDAPPQNRFAFAFFSGLAFGVASYFFSAVTVFLYVVAALMLALIIYSPESGLLAAIILIPAANSDIIYIVITAALVSYFFKLLRGKRNLTLKSEDIVALFAAAVFVIAFRTESAAKTAITVCVFFMASNLLRSADLLRKSAVCITLGLGVNTVFGAAESIATLFGMAPGTISGVLPVRLLTHDPLLTVVSVLWVFCVMHSRSFKMPSVFKVVFFTAAVLETAFSLSDTVIAAVLITTFIYFAFRSGRFFNVLFAYAAVLPLVWLVRFIVSGFVTFAPVAPLLPDLSGLSATQLLFGGAECGTNLFAVFISSFGLLGCALTLLMLLMLLSRAMAAASARAEGMRQFCAAAVASVTAILLLGVCYDTLGTRHDLVLFWALCGMISACGNVIPYDTGADYS